MNMQIIDYRKFSLRVGIIALCLMLALALFFNQWLGHLRSPQDVKYYNVTVNQGDSLWSLAQTHMEYEDIRTAVEMIIQLNELNPDGSIQAGQSLKLPFEENREGYAKAQ